MAHYKRKRPRTSPTHNAKSGGFFLSHWPRWFDILMHTRRRRREADKITRAVIRGERDPDAASWPNSKRPTQYYW